MKKLASLVSLLFFIPNLVQSPRPEKTIEEKVEQVSPKIIETEENRIYPNYITRREVRENRPRYSENKLDTISGEYNLGELMREWSDNQDILQGYSFEIDYVSGHRAGRIIESKEIEDIKKTLKEMEEATKDIIFNKK